MWNTVNMPVYLCVCVCGCYLITGLYSDKTSQITCLSTVCLSFCSNWHEINHQSCTFLALCEGKPQVTDGLPSQRAEKVESAPMSWRVMAYIHPTQQVSKTRKTKILSIFGKTGTSTGWWIQNNALAFREVQRTSNIRNRCPHTTWR